MSWSNFKAASLSLKPFSLHFFRKVRLINFSPGWIGFEKRTTEIFFIVLFGLENLVRLIVRWRAAKTPTIVGLWAFLILAHCKIWHSWVLKCRPPLDVSQNGRPALIIPWTSNKIASPVQINTYSEFFYTHPARHLNFSSNDPQYFSFSGNGVCSRLAVLTTRMCVNYGLNAKATKRSSLLL